jgi:hypothetical protein
MADAAPEKCVLAPENCAPAPERRSPEWYIFAGVEGRYVARNFSLDGNLFRDGPRVSKLPFVYDMTYGLSTPLSHRWRLTLYQIRRSPEFEAQLTNSKKYQSVGAILISRDL